MSKFRAISSALGALCALAPTMPASAQEQASTQMGSVTVSIGGGPAILSLPDVKFMSFTDLGPQFTPSRNTIRKFSDGDDIGDETGLNVGGTVSVPVSGFGNPVLSLNGFRTRIDDKDNARCESNPPAGTSCKFTAIIDDPTESNTLSSAVANSEFTTETRRDVEHSGISLESRWQLGGGISGVTRAPKSRYLAFGVDVRQIDQDVDIAGLNTNPVGAPNPVSYSEDLDTRYTGAYAAWGGDYSLPFLSNLAGNLGLRSTFMLRGGVYHAEADYLGSISAIGRGAAQTLALSRNETAFIGGLVLETSKRIGRRSALSLKSEYEYYSWVPEMRLNDTDVSPGNVFQGVNNGTSIGSGDAFSARTMLRLTVGLGPSELYQ